VVTQQGLSLSRSETQPCAAEVTLDQRSPSDFNHLYFTQKALFDSLLALVEAKISASLIHKNFAKRFKVLTAVLLMMQVL
jgi:hypothetical protein